MATQSQSKQEVQLAAQLVLEQEEKRKRLARLRARRASRRREKEQLAAVQRMQQSIETMKLCILSITAIMLAGVVIAIWVLAALNSKLHEVQAEMEQARPQVEEIVQQVETIVVQVGDAVDEVEKVRDALRNPMQSMGSMFGAELDAKLNKLIGARTSKNE